MSEVELRDPTGDRRADKILQGVIGIFGQAFPGRVRGYYLRGSYATGTPTAGSDLDMFVVFKDAFVDRAEAVRARELADSCALLAPLLLEIIAVGESQLRRPDNAMIALNLKLGTRLVCGEDIRPDLPELEPDSYVRSVVHTPYYSYTYPPQRQDRPLTYPLTHIDPEGPFYGYDQWLITGPDGTDLPSTKLLIASVCWTATALVALQTGRYVRDKGDSVALYREHIGDRWSELVARVYELCRNRWHYHIPPAEADRAALRTLCDQALEFQNHFLTRYRRYLLAELRSGEPDRQTLAAQRLAQIIFPDPEASSILE